VFGSSVNKASDTEITEEITVKDIFDQKGGFFVLAKNDITQFYQYFIQLARNRSNFKKQKSADKYRIRGSFDNNLR
jgi:hypothetical protein